MIFRVTLKDPDVLYDSINESLDEELKASGLSDDEQEAIRELRYEKISELASKWFEYGEYLTVEIDTDKETIKVIENET